MLENHDDVLWPVPLVAGTPEAKVKSRRGGRRRVAPVLDDITLWDGDARHCVLRKDALRIVKQLPNNYVGNKKKVLWPMAQFLEKQGVPFNSVLDAFSGSGVVSVLFALLGKQVICNDLLSSSVIQAFCMLVGQPCPLTVDDWGFLVNHHPTKAMRLVRDNYVDRFENRRLFEAGEADFLDRFRQNVRERFGPLDIRSDGVGIGNVRAAYALYAMLKHINDRCFVGGRYYNGQTVCRVEWRIAHSRNQGTRIHETFMETVRKLQFPVFNRVAEPRIFNQDVMALLQDQSVTADLLYLDPPYGGESSDYINLYRFLEEYIRGETYDSVASQALQHSGERFNDDQGYAGQFRELLAHCHRFPTWLVSFNASSFASLEEIVALVGEFRPNVLVHSEPYRYHQRKNRTEKTEYEHFILAGLE